MPVASEIREGLDNVAAAMRTLASVLAWEAAAKHSDTHGRQREMAAVVFRDAETRFADVKLDDKRAAELDAWITGLMKAKK